MEFSAVVGFCRLLNEHGHALALPRATRIGVVIFRLFLNKLMMTVVSGLPQDHFSLGCAVVPHLPHCIRAPSFIHAHTLISRCVRLRADSHSRWFLSSRDDLLRFLGSLSSTLDGCARWFDDFILFILKDHSMIWSAVGLEVLFMLLR